MGQIIKTTSKHIPTREPHTCLN